MWTENERSPMHNAERSALRIRYAAGWFSNRYLPWLAIPVFNAAC